MASTASTMQALGFEAPAFTLPNTHLVAGRPMVSLSDYAGSKAVLIAFICNHCPYVIHPVSYTHLTLPTKRIV